MIFGLSRSPGFISHAIRLFSWGSWSHAFLVIDGMVYESREFVGVHCVPYAAAVAGTSAVQLFRVPSTPEQDQTIMAFACAHLPDEEASPPARRVTAAAAAAPYAPHARPSAPRPIHHRRRLQWGGRLPLPPAARAARAPWRPPHRSLQARSRPARPRAPPA